jgi:prepilin-type N-terminal cleavage/methylation domain-containing protein
MNYFSKLKINGGFTLVELLVVISIATIITTSLVFQQSSWNDQLAVKTQGYEMALMIRQAQIYSLSVREDTGGSGDKFNIGYGVYFDTDNTRYIYFADRNGNQMYEPGEEIEVKTFTKGVLIKDVCGIASCIYFGGGPMQKVNISFLRPDPKANMMLTNNGGQKKDDPPVSITLKSPRGVLSLVKVEANGQVSIQ